jgi:hypothetical protein
MQTTTTDQLRIDLLFLDLERCTRCRGTDASLEAALAVVHDVLAARGTAVEVNKVHVASAEQARELRFESSPTIRVNGRDIALELRESSCGSEACTDGCGESIDCRVWVHAGNEYTEPPVALVADAILREVYGGAVARPEPDPEPYELPANLQRFFADEQAAEACCSASEQRSCCEPEDKAECCGAATGGSCGCR